MLALRGTSASHTCGGLTLPARWEPTATSGPAYDTAREKAGLEYRLYDARHTFVTRLAENPKISEDTIRQLAGHVRPRMLQRYAHIRVQARRDAIATLERLDGPAKTDFEGESPQKSPQSEDKGVPVLN